MHYALKKSSKMELNCVIIDDEPQAVELIKNYISRTPNLTVRAGYTDSVEGLSKITENPPDILFLDIQMPDLNGMELSKMVPKQTKIIFTTAFKQYAFESYDVSAADYLLKPISYAKFLKAAQKCIEWFELKESAAQTSSAPSPTPSQTSSNDIFVKSDGMMVRVNLSQLLYVCGLKDYVKFVMQPPTKPIITLMTMKAVEEMLLPYGLMRVNRSYIVAVDKIKSVDKNDCIYIGDEIIHVTDVYRNDVFKKLFALTS